MASFRKKELKGQISTLFHAPDGAESELMQTYMAAESELKSFTRKEISELSVNDLCKFDSQLMCASQNLKYYLIGRIMIILLDAEEFPDNLGFFLDYMINQLANPNVDPDESVLGLISMMSAAQRETLIKWLDVLADENEGLFYCDQRDWILCGEHKKKILQIAKEARN
jgi:hypothetical protein